MLQRSLPSYHDVLPQLKALLLFMARLPPFPRSIVPIRAALSLVGSCGNIPCAIDVVEASPFLAGLACDRYL